MQRVHISPGKLFVPFFCLALPAKTKFPDLDKQNQRQEQHETHLKNETKYSIYYNL